MLTTDVIFGNKDWEVQRLQGKVKYNSPEVKAVYDKFAGWVKKGYFGKGFMGLTYQQCEEMFATGKGAMFPMGNWFIGDLANLKPEFDVGWFLYPTKDGNGGYLKALGNSFSISAQTKNPEQVLKFYKWLTTSAEAVGIISERMSLIPDISETVNYKMNPLMQDILDTIKGKDGTIWAYAQWGDNAPPPGAYDFCVKISQDVAAGADITSSLQKFDEEYDKLLKAR
jgi:ABC-type sugar transport system, periplasmic component